MRFNGNRYVGRHVDPPGESAGASDSAPKPMRFDGWPGPQLDPREPEKSKAYLKAHRAWMLRLMKRESGRVK